MTTTAQFREASIARSRKEDTVISPEQARILLCTTGLAGEAGEVADSMKKHVWHGKPFDREHTIEEVGDVLWYADRLLWLLDCTMEECMQVNMDKLAARYPDGFKSATAVAQQEPETCLRPPHNRCAYASGDGDGCDMLCALRHPAQ